MRAPLRVPMAKRETFARIICAQAREIRASGAPTLPVLRWSSRCFCSPLAEKFIKSPSARRARLRGKKKEEDEVCGFGREKEKQNSHSNICEAGRNSSPADWARRPAVQGWQWAHSSPGGDESSASALRGTGDKFM